MAHCDHDLSVLVIKGNPTSEQLNECWADLYKQYINAIGGSAFSSRMQIVKDYEKLRAKVLRASYCLQLAEIGTNIETICNIINSFKYPITKATKDNLSTAIAQFEGHLKSDIMRLNKLTTSLEKQQKGAKNEEAKEEDYIGSLFDISEVLKVPFINPKKITVHEYCVYIAKFNQHVERLIKQHEKAKQ